jgi:hypothetical protein
MTKEILCLHMTKSLTQNPSGSPFPEEPFVYTCMILLLQLQLQLQLYFISIDPYWLKPAKGYRTSQKYIYIQID